MTADEPQYLLTAISLGEDLDLDISDERADEPLPRLPRGGAARAGATLGRRPRGEPARPAPARGPRAADASGGWIGAKLVLAALAGRARRAHGVDRGACGSPCRRASRWSRCSRSRRPRRSRCTAPRCIPSSRPRSSSRSRSPRSRVDIKPKLVVLTVASIVALPWLSVKYAPVAAALAVVAALRWWRAGDRDAVLWGGGVLALAGAVVPRRAPGLVRRLDRVRERRPLREQRRVLGGRLQPELRRPRDPTHRSAHRPRLRARGVESRLPARDTRVCVRSCAAGPPRGTSSSIPLAVGWFNATFVALTMHGWWWPGRQTVVVLPCVVLAVAWWAAPSRAALWAVGVLGAIGASIYAWLVARGDRRRPHHGRHVRDHHAPARARVARAVARLPRCRCRRLGAARDLAGRTSPPP